MRQQKPSREGWALQDERGLGASTKSLPTIGTGLDITANQPAHGTGFKLLHRLARRLN